MCVVVCAHRALTIAQMQGKFQMLVVRHSGHAIQVWNREEGSIISGRSMWSWYVQMLDDTHRLTEDSTLNGERVGLINEMVCECGLWQFVDLVEKRVGVALLGSQRQGCGIHGKRIYYTYGGMCFRKTSQKSLRHLYWRLYPGTGLERVEWRSLA